MTHTSTNYLESDGDRCAQDEMMAGPQTEAWTVACVHITLVLMSLNLLIWPHQHQGLAKRAINHRLGTNNQSSHIHPKHSFWKKINYRIFGISDDAESRKYSFLAYNL